MNKYKKKDLAAASDVALVLAGAEVMGSQARLSAVCGASQKALCRARSGGALPPVARPFIIRAILRTQSRTAAESALASYRAAVGGGKRGADPSLETTLKQRIETAVVPDLPHVRGRPISPVNKGASVALDLAPKELDAFDAAAKQHPEGNKGLLTEAVRRFVNGCQRRRRHEPPVPIAFPDEVAHRRCRIDAKALTDLNAALGIYEHWRSNYLRMAIVGHLLRLGRLKLHKKCGGCDLCRYLEHNADLREDAAA